MSRLRSSYDEGESNYRIIRKNLLYLIGISERLADSNLLSKHEYLGQYGKIIKIIINKKNPYNIRNKYGPSFSAYVTYSNSFETSIAILSLDSIIVDNHLIRASFGTTKYCSYFLRKIKCTNKDCAFLHKKANECDIIKKIDLINNKEFLYEQQLYAIKVGNIYDEKIKEKILSLESKKNNLEFPSPSVIYTYDIVIENEKNYKKKSISTQSTPSNKLNTLKQKEDKLNSLEINKIMLNELDTATCTTSSISKEDFNDSNLPLNNILFSNKETSRFDFANKNIENEVNVPLFINKIINKASKMIGIKKYFKDKRRVNDLFMFKEEMKVGDENWKSFIINSNKDKFNEISKKDDLVNDFDKINDFILKKTSKNQE